MLSKLHEAYIEETEVSDINNKGTERAELHKTIWRIANDLRGSVAFEKLRLFFERFLGLA